MKMIRSLSLVMSLLVITMITPSFVLADMNAADIVNQFNTGSGQPRTLFSYGSNGYEVQLTQVNSLNHVDTSAYLQGVTGGRNYFSTVCVEPTVGVYSTMSSVLNYANNTSSNSLGNSLTVGAAYLYSQFAVGTLGVGTSFTYNYSNTSARSTSYNNLVSAIRGLMGVSGYSPDWNNPFMKLLLSVQYDKDLWTNKYDPNQYYDVIGNYSVFVMNNRDSSGTYNSQNFLYVTKTNGSDVPEPATIFLWGLGSLGALAVKRTRNCRLNLA